MNKVRQHWRAFLLVLLLLVAVTVLIYLNWDNAKNLLSGGGGAGPSWTPPTGTPTAAVEFDIQGGGGATSTLVPQQPTVQPQTPVYEQSVPQEEWRFWTVNWDCSKLTCNTICSPDIVFFNSDSGRYEVVQLPDCAATLRVNGGSVTLLMNSVAMEDELRWEVKVSCPSQGDLIFKGTLYPQSYLGYHPRWLKIVYEGESCLRTAPLVSDYSYYAVANQGDIFQLLGKVEGESVKGNSDWYVIYDQKYKMVLYVHSSLAWEPGAPTTPVPPTVPIPTFTPTSAPPTPVTTSTPVPVTKVKFLPEFNVGPLEREYVTLWNESWETAFLDAEWKIIGIWYDHPSGGPTQVDLPPGYQIDPRQVLYVFTGDLPMGMMQEGTPTPTPYEAIYLRRSQELWPDSSGWILLVHKGIIMDCISYGDVPPCEGLIGRPVWEIPSPVIPTPTPTVMIPTSTPTPTSVPVFPVKILDINVGPVEHEYIKLVNTGTEQMDRGKIKLYGIWRWSPRTEVQLTGGTFDPRQVLYVFTGDFPVRAMEGTPTPIPYEAIYLRRNQELWDDNAGWITVSYDGIIVDCWMYGKVPSCEGLIGRYVSEIPSNIPSASS